MEISSKIFDEMFGGTGNTCRRPYRVYNKWFKNEKIDQLLKQSRDAEHFFRRSGITFNIQGNNTETEHLIPFDIVPRILSGKEWGFLERGLKQRAIAINMFLSDIYHKQEIIRAGKFPFELVKNNTAFPTFGCALKFLFGKSVSPPVKLSFK